MLDRGTSPDPLGHGEPLKAVERGVDMEGNNARVMYLALL